MARQTGWEFDGRWVCPDCQYMLGTTEVRVPTVGTLERRAKGVA